MKVALYILPYGRHMYRRAIDVIMRSIRMFVSSNINCEEGCQNEWPSQIDHDCLMRFDDYMDTCILSYGRHMYRRAIDVIMRSIRM